MRAASTRVSSLVTKPAHTWQVRGLAFLGLLRVSELAALGACDVIFPEDPRVWGEVHTLLILEHTKTGDDKSAEVQQRCCGHGAVQHVVREGA